MVLLEEALIFLINKLKLNSSSEINIIFYGYVCLSPWKSLQGDAATISFRIFKKIDLTFGLINWKILLKVFNFSRLHATNRQFY